MADISGLSDVIQECSSTSSSSSDSGKQRSDGVKKSMKTSFEHTNLCTSVEHEITTLKNKLDFINLKLVFKNFSKIKFKLYTIFNVISNTY